MKKVLITGIDGFLGSVIANTLQKKYEVFGIQRNPKKLKRIKKGIFKIYKFDDDIEEIFNEYHFFSVIHTATVYSKNNIGISYLKNTNIEMPIKLMQLSSKYGIKLFINTDTFTSYSKLPYDYLTDYHNSKKECLNGLLEINNRSETKLVNMIIFHMFGENDGKQKFVTRIIDDLKNNRIIKLTKGNQKRDFIHVQDVANAYYCILKNFNLLKFNFQSFEVGSGNSISIKNFVLKLKKLTKSSSKLHFGALPMRKGEFNDSYAKNANLIKMKWKISEELDFRLRDLI